jgi:hypothetical protein
LWTAGRVERLIEQRLGISFHPEHVRKILKRRLGWTGQKRKHKARQRNDKVVEKWKADDLPRILREAWKRQAHLVLLDESGFQSTPSVRRPLAPRGQTPVLECSDRNSCRASGLYLRYPHCQRGCCGFKPNHPLSKTFQYLDLRHRSRAQIEV